MLYPVLRSLLFRLDPERSHDLVLGQLARASRSPVRTRALRALWGSRVPELASTVMGIRFPNPVGLAAGLDKQGNCANAMCALGFGWVELGTVTPQPQPGNPLPRMFRLTAQRALINRMGFNSIGLERFIDNVRQTAPGIVLGINIGKNAATPIERANEDYLTGMTAVYGLADYITINISSPNTSNLRSLQEDAALESLLSALEQHSQSLADQHGRRVPLVLKIAPDLDDAQIQAIAQLVRRFSMDGVAATNTTLCRQGVEASPHAGESGGLSGVPVRDAATTVIRKLHQALEGAVPIIGMGGIHCPADAGKNWRPERACYSSIRASSTRGPHSFGESSMTWISTEAIRNGRIGSRRSTNKRPAPPRERDRVQPHLRCRLRSDGRGRARHSPGCGQ